MVSVLGTRVSAINLTPLNGKGKIGCAGQEEGQGILLQKLAEIGR